MDPEKLGKFFSSLERVVLRQLRWFLDALSPLQPTTPFTGIRDRNVFRQVVSDAAGNGRRIHCACRSRDVVCCAGMQSAAAVSHAAQWPFGAHRVYFDLCIWQSGGGALGRLLSARPFQLAGEASYSVYILQVPIWLGFSRIIGSDHPRGMADFLGYLTFLIVVSALVLRFIEIPGRKMLSNRLGKPKSRQNEGDVAMVAGSSTSSTP